MEKPEIHITVNAAFCAAKNNNIAIKIGIGAYVVGLPMVLICNAIAVLCLQTW
ncbi:MAG: hypothetical protein LBS28_01115 [Streptococcaceae bacterium]|nr:hypothetical protein [Streptococcaceae bacterium]